MPRIINTIEGWIRQHKRDLYYFQFSNELNEKQRQENEKALRDLLTNDFPATPVELLGPSEYCGWIAGGPKVLAVDFSEDDAKKFFSEWENTEGKSKDKRWQCYLYALQVWQERVSYFPQITQATLPKTFSAFWFVSPHGILMIGQNPQGYLASKGDAEAIVYQLGVEGCENAHLWPSGICRVHENSVSILKTIADDDGDISEAELALLPAIIKLKEFLLVTAQQNVSVTWLGD